MALLVYAGGTSINVGIIMKLFGTLIKSGSMRKSLGILLIASSLILCIVIAGCTQAQTLPAPTAKPTAVPTTVVPINGCDMNAQDKASMAFMNNTNLRNVSFCEIIVWCGDGGTYNTMSLNAKGDSCPEALFLGLNKTELAIQYQVSSVGTNPDTGRKFWTADEFDAIQSTTVRDFDGMKARYSGDTGATPSGEPQDLSAEGIPAMMYQPITFYRTSTLIWEKGQPVFIIDDANGTTWVNKNFQNGVDPTLTYKGMSTLGTRLKSLPPGWKFRTVILKEDLVFKADGAWPIMWDELGGAYDQAVPGKANYIP